MPRAARITRRALCSMLLVPSTLLGHVALAQSSMSTDDLRDCATIELDAERLGCYDALARRISPDPPQPPEPDASAATSASPAAIAAFGSELIENDDVDTPQQIQSRLVGEFTGWRGNTQFRLENGQVWRQVEAGTLVYSADAPLVTIRRGSFNSYRLSIEGVNSSVRVRRIE